MNDLELILQEYVVSANDPKANGDWDLINSEFPELADFDPMLLQEYVTTANDPKANGDWDLINSKFPEFNSNPEAKYGFSGGFVGKNQQMMTNFQKNEDGVIVEGTSTGERPTVQSKIQDDILDIKNSINKDSDVVMNRLAKEYFSLDNFKREKTPPKMAGQNQTPFKNTLEEDLKAYFEEEKYEQYLEYQKDGIFNSDWVDKSTAESQVDRLRQEQIEDYVSGIGDEDVKKKVKIAAEEGAFNLFDVGEGDWYKMYEDALNVDRLKQEKIAEDVDVGISNALKEVEGDFSSKEAMDLSQTQSETSKVLTKYFTHKYTQLESDGKDFSKNVEAYDKIKNTYEPNIISLKNQLKNLNDEENSPDSKKIQHNAIVEEINSSIEKYSNELTKSNLSQEDLVKTQESLQSRHNKLGDNTDKIKDLDMIAKSLAKDYSFSTRASLYFEQGIADITAMAAGALNTFAVGAEYVEGIGELASEGKYAEIAESVIGKGNIRNLRSEGDAGTKYMHDEFQRSLDFRASLANYTQTALPLDIKWKDMDSENWGRYSKQLLGNNVFTIASALTYSGAIKAGMNVPIASKVLQTTFFGVEGGSKLGTMNEEQANAPEMIAGLQVALEQATTPDERIKILKQIDYQEKALNVTEIGKAFSSIVYGGIATYAEKLGTMRYVRNMSRVSPAGNRLTWGGVYKGGKQTVFNTGIEYVEEVGTQIGHNLWDVAYLNQNKSLLAGIDADFNANILFSTLAIQSPSTSMNIVNTIRSEVSTQIEIGKNRARQKQLIENNEVLQAHEEFGDILTADQKIELEMQNAEILRTAALVDAYTFADVANMTAEEVHQMFEENQIKRDELNKMENLGAQSVGEKANSSYIKEQKETIINNIKEIDRRIEKLRGKPTERQKEIIGEILEQENQKAETAFWVGRAFAAKNIAKGLGKVKEFEGKVIKNPETGELEIDLTDVEKYLTKKVKSGKITEEDKASYLKGFREGNTAAILGNEALLIEGNVIRNINNAETNLERSITAYSVIHEIQHLNDISQGLVKDGDVVASQRAAVEGIMNEIKTAYDQGRMTDEEAGLIIERIKGYNEDNGGNVDLMEFLAVVGELKDAGILNENSTDPLLSLKLMINQFATKHFGDGDMFVRLKDAKEVLQYIDRFQNKVRSQTLVLGPEEDKEIKFSKAELNKKSPEDLIKIIKRKSSRQDQIKAANEALVPQYEAMVVEALKYKEAKGDITRENVVSAASVYYNAIVKNYNPKKGAFSTHVYGNIAPKNDTIFEDAKSIFYGQTISTDAKEARQVEDTSTETTNTEKTFVQKINILQDFAIANRVADKIKALVKVVKGDNFKSIISKYAGKVGELIFEIPAKKIMEGGANLAAVTKYTEGMPAPAEAQNIQRVFNAPNNADKFIKTLPLYNVTDKTADINKVGENLEVSRDTYGYAIGLKGLPLDYFYENYTDPKALSKDPKVYEQRVTSKAGRSMGLTSQTPMKRLKPQFRKPTPETVEQFKKDLGITPKNEANVYNRDIGQLLKGVAKVHSINAAISGAQRVQEAKLKTAPVTEQKAIKQQTADITAAQSKVAFSSRIKDLALNTDKLKWNGKEIILAGRTVQFLETIKDGVVKGEIITRKHLNEYKDAKNKITWEEFYVNELLDFFKSYPQYYNVMQTALTGGIKKAAFFNKPYFEAAIKRYAKKNGKQDIMKLISKTKQIEPKRLNYHEKRKWKGLTNLDLSKDDGKLDFLLNLFGDIGKHVSKTGKGKEIFQEVLTHFGIDQSNFMRHSARVIGYPVNPKTSKDYKVTKTENNNPIGVEEHAVQMEMARIMMGMAFDGNIKDASKLLKAVYSQISLRDNEDPGGVYKQSMGNDFYDNVVPRVLNGDLDFLPDGFVSIYRLMKAGVNPFGYKLIGPKQTIAKYFGVNNLSVEKAQQTIVDVFEGKQDIEVLRAQSRVKFSKNIENHNKLNNAIKFSRSTNNESNGITVLDFDDTLATTKSNILTTAPDGTKGKMNAEEYASNYEDLAGQGYTFDFSEFNKVVKGKKAPLFEKALKLQGKFGPENMFILTARPMEAAPAIFEFLKANGLNIPIKNITGLANSTAEAKALWIADKVGEGYNDFYFADDALQNVKAVKNMLDQFDVKSKVQQARVKFSKSMNTDFNNILENVTGIESKKRFSDIKARKRGDSKGKFRFFIPPSHEDFVGLLYNFMGKGKEGNAHRDFFEKALVGPLNRGYREIDTAKQAIANDHKELNKQFPDVKKKLIKNTPDGDFTFQDAIRVYLWNKHGYKIPGLTPTDQTKLVELVMNDAELQAYAETLNVISKQEKYVDPGQSWEAGNIRIDLIDATGRVGRAEYFAEFNENAEVMFSPENLNKIEAAYGKDFREALEDMLHRIKTGVNRPKGSSSKPNMFMNWLNASVSGVMFFNTRSALLQQLSNVNFLNFADNNIYAAGKAFANQPQYWKDFAMIFNSDMLKQRRGGLGTDINGAELAEAIKKARPDNMFDQVSIIVGKALKLGFLPTQIGDNIAIATGGAAFYRNRVNKYIKDGLSVKNAEAKAFTDLQNITNSTQQSARPDMTSKQQASWIGKLVLNFLNTPSQYNRIIKKAGSDVLNRRITPPNTTQAQSDMSNVSRILYYGAAQNLIFYSLQTALFAVMFDTDDEDDDKRAEQFLKKKERVINGTIDTILRGSGIYGVAVSTLKNMIIKFLEQRDPEKYNKDEAAVLTEALNFSPVVGIKARRIVNAEKTLNYNVGVMNEMETFDAENPTWSAVTNYTQAITGAPVNKIYQKAINLKNAADNQYTALQRVLFLSGYTTWSLNLGDTEKMKEVKAVVKEKKKIESKKKSKIKREEKKKVDLKEKETKGIEKQKQEKKDGKQVTCLVCKLPIEKGKKYCTIHEKTEQRKDGKKRQCVKRKSDGKRCGMQTSNKSGYCYYHD